jgi:hypothetical protein
MHRFFVLRTSQTANYEVLMSVIVADRVVSAVEASHVCQGMTSITAALACQSRQAHHLHLSKQISIQLYVYLRACAALMLACELQQHCCSSAGVTAATWTQVAPVRMPGEHASAFEAPSPLYRQHTCTAFHACHCCFCCRCAVG